MITPVLAIVLGACGGSEAETGAATKSDGKNPASPSAREVRISAAASLTDAFSQIASAFRRVHPGMKASLNFAASSTLREQILEGAPVDVFAPADRWNMGRVLKAGEVAGEPVVFARNRLRIAVPPGNPAGVTGLRDFGDAHLILGLCAPGVPCGDLARRALARGGVTPEVDTHEPHVRALLTKVELGELDAGITYVTDVAAREGAVEGIDIPENVNVSATYLVAVLARAPNPDGARAFVEFVLSDTAQAILRRHGFAPGGGGGGS